MLLTYVVLALSLSIPYGFASPQPPPQAASLDQTIAEARRDIAEAVDILNEKNRDITEKRRAWSENLNHKHKEILALQDKRQALIERQRAGGTDLERLQEKIAEQNAALAHIQNLFARHRQAAAAQLGIGAAQAYEKQFDQIDRLFSYDADHPDQIKAAELLLLQSIEYIERSMGGALYEGKAQAADGTVFDGLFAEFGPAAYFYSHREAGPAGLATYKPNSLIPAVITPTKSTRQEVQTLFEHGDGAPPLDPTLGTALQLLETQETLWQHLSKGRTIIIPLLLLGISCAGIALYKFVQLASLTSPKSIQDMDKVLDALHNNQIEIAATYADNLRRPLSSVIAEGIRHRQVSKEHLEEVMYEKLISQTPILERFLAPLAVCASAAPLLGLLGTVTGMIHTFKLITVFGTGDARVLSSGISEALVTTEVGLLIAIPALLIHAYLSRRVRRAISLTQQAAIKFVNQLKLGNRKAASDKDS